jgi:hypothetical protein
MKESENNRPTNPQRLGQETQNLLQSLNDKAEDRRRKAKAPDDDIVFWHNGYSVNIGSHWNNKDEPMSRPAVKLDLSRIPPGTGEIRAYLCPRTDKKTPGKSK